MQPTVNEEHRRTYLVDFVQGGGQGFLAASTRVALGLWWSLGACQAYGWGWAALQLLVACFPAEEWLGMLALLVPS